MNLVGFRVQPHEDVNESGRTFRLLPDRLAQRARFVLAHVRDEFMNRDKTLVEALRPHFVTRHLVDLESPPWYRGHEHLLGLAEWPDDTGAATALARHRTA